MKYVKFIAFTLVGLLTAPTSLVGAASVQDKVLQNVYNDQGRIIGQTRSAESASDSVEAKYKVSRHSHKTDAFEVYYPQVDLSSILTSALVNYQLIQAPGRYMADAPEAAKLKLDYTVTRQDENLISVVFRGEHKQGDNTLPLLTSVNYNLKSRLPVTAQRLFKNESKQNIARVLQQAADANSTIGKAQSFDDLENFYITGKYIVFFVKNSAEKFTELPVTIDSLRPYLADEYASLALKQEVQKDPRQVIADIDKSLISYDSISGKYETGDSLADFSAYYAEGKLVYLEEKQSGDHYSSKAKYYYDQGKLVAYRKSVQGLNIPEGGIADVQREETTMLYDSALNLTDGERMLNGETSKLTESEIQDIYAASENLMRLAFEQQASDQNNSQQ